MAFSPDSAFFAVSNSERVDLYEFGSMRLVHSWSPKDSGQNAGGGRSRCMFSPSGKILYVTGFSPGLLTMSLDHPFAIQTREFPSAEAIAFDVTGEWLVLSQSVIYRLANDGTDAIEPIVRGRWTEGWVWDRLLMPRSKRIILGMNDTDGKVVDYETGNVQSFRAWSKASNWVGSSIFCLSTNLDETLLIAGGKHSEAQLLKLDPQTHEPVGYDSICVGSRVVRVALHPKLSVCAIRTLDGRVTFFDIESRDTVAPALTNYAGGYGW